MNPSVLSKIEQFFEKYPQKEYKAGQILIFSGDKASNVYLLQEGRVKIADINYKGDELILHIFHPPIFFPMALVVNNRRSPYWYQADSDIVVRQAPADDVHRFVRENSDVIYTLLGRMYAGTDVLLDRIAHLMSGDATTRVRFEILTFGKYHGQINGDECSFRIRERELAARTGLTRETVSREIKKLLDKGLIQREGSVIRIPKLNEFERIVSPNLFLNE